MESVTVEDPPSGDDLGIDNVAQPVKVAVNIRPLIESEVQSGCRESLTVFADYQQVWISAEKAFTFDHVYGGGGRAMNHIFEDCVVPLIDGFFQGYNATVLAYGQTGSGKTYTMGTGYTDGGKIELGVVPQVMKTLFQKVNSLSAKTEFSLRISFIEIHKEEIRDLLDNTEDHHHKNSRRLSGSPQNNFQGPEKSPIAIRELPNGVSVVGAVEVEVSSYEEMMSCLSLGMAFRSTGSHMMNARSSRSHAIFTISMEQRAKALTNEMMPPGRDSPPLLDSPGGQEHLFSKIHLVDLAGSERIKRTKAEGNRLKEGIHINKGLLALGNVISALGDERRRSMGGTQPVHVPYRDSKLTRLLQDSLGGNSRTVMIACVSPADINLDETLNTLKYANRARNIKNKPIVNRVGESPEDELRALRQQLALLQAQVNRARQGQGEMGEEKGKEGEQPSVPALEEEVKALRKRVAFLEASNSKYRESLGEARDSLLLAGERLHEMEAELAQRDRDTQAALDSLAKLKSRLADKDAELARAKQREAEASGKLREALEESQVESQNVQVEAEERIGELEAQVKTREEAQAKTIEKIRELEAQVVHQVKTTERLVELELQVESQVKITEKAEAELRKEREIHTSTAEELKRIKKELDGFRIAFGAAEKKLIEAEEKSVSLEDQVRAAERISAAARRGLEEARTELVNWRGKTFSVSQQLAQKEEENKNLKSEIEVFQENLAAKSEKIAELEWRLEEAEKRGKSIEPLEIPKIKEEVEEEEEEELEKDEEEEEGEEESSTWPPRNVPAVMPPLAEEPSDISESSLDSFSTADEENDLNLNEENRDLTNKLRHSIESTDEVDHSGPIIDQDFNPRDSGESEEKEEYPKGSSGEDLEGEEAVVTVNLGENREESGILGGELGAEEAAKRIQSQWRAQAARKRFLEMKKAAVVIQYHWRNSRQLLSTSIGGDMSAHTESPPDSPYRVDTSNSGTQSFPGSRGSPVLQVPDTLEPWRKLSPQGEKQRGEESESEEKMRKEIEESDPHFKDVARLSALLSTRSEELKPLLGSSSSAGGGEGRENSEGENSRQGRQRSILGILRGRRVQGLKIPETEEETSDRKGKKPGGWLRSPSPSRKHSKAVQPLQPTLLVSPRTFELKLSEKTDKGPISPRSFPGTGGESGDIRTPATAGSGNTTPKISAGRLSRSESTRVVRSASPSRAVRRTSSWIDNGELFSKNHRVWGSAALGLHGPEVGITPGKAKSGLLTNEIKSAIARERVAWEPYVFNRSLAKPRRQSTYEK